ncbi:MAG TPA: 4-(cytidine 5'-diphospho)-2-C-methyl-D-erythritol kinase [Candidatus Angelobacter sp.]|nr:4-(cytidine 5'-diphospho)-2-C-methyl-D-erythritol kinase [Candidatus Angelobacter sp.]
MSTSVRSFAKINIGLKIGPLREDGFHELRTIYQTIALADVVRVDVGKGLGIDIACKDKRVPADESNTCWRVAERVLKQLKMRGKVRITIEKNLPVQGGLGAASSNAVATMLALEKELKQQLPPEERLRIASEVGSDLPLFLVGGTVLGTGRGEQVFPLDDLPSWHCVVATPEVGVSTPAAFADWDEKNGTAESGGVPRSLKPAESGKLTERESSDRISTFSRSVYEWLNGSFSLTGVPDKGWDRAEALLLDLVRTGIENDFESVVFPKYPAIREVKRALERSGAKYVSLSGSGSAVYGLFSDQETATLAAEKLNDQGVPAQATVTLTRERYWKEMMGAGAGQRKTG